MSNVDGSAFQEPVARLDYLSLDRADLQFAAKEVAKRMAQPREADRSKLKRVACYKMRVPREIYDAAMIDL